MKRETKTTTTTTNTTITMYQYRDPAPMMASSSPFPPSSSSSSPPHHISPRKLSPPLTLEITEQENKDNYSCSNGSNNVQGATREPRSLTTAAGPHHHQHQPTPLHPSSKKPPKPTPSSASASVGSVSVSCSGCRPSSRDKPSVVPLDPPPSSPSLFRSLILNLSRRTTPSRSSAAATPSTAAAEEWRLAAAELSRKLLAATRKRDEALLEASRLKYSLSELQSQLSLLHSPPPLPFQPFLRSVSHSRSSTRLLARSLSSRLQNPNPNPNPNLLLLPDYMESFLNRVLFSGFELDDEDETRLADPLARCASNRAACEAVRALTWDQVLNKGTKHYSEALSRFCDRKMSDVVGSVGSNRPWTEPLLQAFFSAAKAAFTVRLMARSVHPTVPIIRVDRGARFDPRFMEDAGTGRAGQGRGEPVSVKMMVAPGFHVYTAGGSGVIKCLVLCLYSRCSGGHSSSGNSGSSTSNSNSNSNSISSVGNSSNSMHSRGSIDKNSGR